MNSPNKVSRFVSDAYDNRHEDEDGFECGMTPVVRLAEVIASAIVGLAFAFTTSLMITMMMMMMKMMMMMMTMATMIMMTMMMATMIRILW